MWSAVQDSNKARFTRTLRAGALLLPIIVVAACGGGSSGGSPSQPPSPPPVPPPSVTFDITEITVLSGASFGTTVGGTADGRSAFAISLSCTNGVSLQNNGGVVSFIVPEASALEQAVCTAGVTDSSGRSANASLSITILPETEIGQVVGIFNPPLKLLLPNFNIAGAFESLGSHVMAVADSTDHSGRYQIRAIEGTSTVPRQYHRDDIVRVEGDYASIDFVQSPSLYAHGLPDASLSIASASENKIYWLLQEPQSRDFTLRETIEVERPCFVAQTNTYWANDMVVGQRDRGLSVFDIETGSNVMDSQSFDATLVYNVGAGRSLCHLLRGVVPESIAQQYPGFQSSSPLTAIDFNTNELVFYGDTDGDNDLDEMGAMAIETHATGHLNIVQVISRGGPTQIPQYLIVLLSDGRHMGEHRVVQINFDSRTREITQRVLHAWSEGVPVSMLQGPLGGSLVGGIFRSDLAVVLGTTEKSFFFDDLLPLEAGFGEPPLYGEPQLFDVGVGAGSAVAAENPRGPGDDADRKSVV